MIEIDYQIANALVQNKQGAYNILKDVMGLY